MYLTDDVNGHGISGIRTADGRGWCSFCGKEHASVATKRTPCCGDCWYDEAPPSVHPVSLAMADGGIAPVVSSVSRGDAHAEPDATIKVERDAERVTVRLYIGSKPIGRLMMTPDEWDNFGSHIEMDDPAGPVLVVRLMAVEA